MKNPLRKRILRELKAEVGKYGVIFLFLVLLISLISGFIVADNSMKKTYDETFQKYNIEDGHFSTAEELDPSLIQDLEDEHNIQIHKLFYKEVKNIDASAKYRIYEKRDAVNRECLMKGEMPVEEDQIAIDRMFADNNKLQIGDLIQLEEMSLKITGFVALSDYSCLFENNGDMMFDATRFSIAIMTKEGYEKLKDVGNTFNYAYTYEKKPTDKMEEKDRSDALLENLKTKVNLTSFLPQHENKAITFTGEDMGRDKALFKVFYYIVMVIITFVFTVTVSNTIVKEAGVIGTLRASGYTRGEILYHYMFTPLTVTLIAALVGNILGYTVFEKHMANLYFRSYSLTTYESLFNMEAFLDTTILPILLMIFIHLTVLTRKLRVSPIKFLRRDLSIRKNKKAIPLSKRISFMRRFRLRILLQNIANYFTLWLGILWATMILIFALMFPPLMENYAKDIENSMFSTYQYVLKAPVEVQEDGAEKYNVTTLVTTQEGFRQDDILIYGVKENSQYFSSEIPPRQVYLSNGFMEKYSLKVGERITLKEKYGDKAFTFTIGGVHKYDAALCVFMSRKDFLKTFEKNADDFNGYFTHKELKSLDKRLIATTITKEDLTNFSVQLKVSIEDMTKLFKIIGIIMFLLLMYLLSKQILEKNGQSIAMAKIIGFTNGEIGRLYIVATSLVVLLSLFLAVPIVQWILKLVFQKYLYKMISGYLPLTVDKILYVKAIVMGILSYCAVAVVQMYKIYKIPKNEALKNVE